MTSTSHCVQDFSSPSSRRKKSTTPVQSPRKAKEVLKAPSLALQSTNNNRHPRSNAAKSVKNLQKYPLLKPCSSRCKKECTLSFSEKQRARFHDFFWGLDYVDRHIYITHFVQEFLKRRGTVKNDSKRVYSRFYTFHRIEIDTKCIEAGYFNRYYEDGQLKKCSDGHIIVCKKFFLSTLGLRADARITKALNMQRSNEELKDKRGGKQINE